jgi:hypothetical protein
MLPGGPPCVYMPLTFRFRTSSNLQHVQYVLPPNSVVYTGCVGDDELAERLDIANKREGLHQACLVKKGEKTGVCAVIITGHHRFVDPLPFLFFVLTGLFEC